MKKIIFIRIKYAKYNLTKTKQYNLLNITQKPLDL